MPPNPIAELLAIVVPPACAACRSPLARADLLLCAACARALPWLPRRTCPRCALPSHGRACPAADAAFNRAWSPLAYDGVARDLVAALKFRAALPLAALMAAHMAANLAPDLRPPPTEPDHVPGGRRSTDPGSVAIVAVPAQPARRRRRGFDPAGVLAVALARRLGVARSDCLLRRDRGGRQVGASRSQRRRSGRLTIELRAPPPARALLIDDVHTTGATLDACARALLGGGCREVVALTYARTL
jgi:predicted amidophosphoribosyltransferase